MLNVSNMAHTALLGQLINTCHISIQLVKRFGKFVDIMLTSRNAIVRHFVRRAIHSAQSHIGRHNIIAVIRHRYAIHVIDIYTIIRISLSPFANCRSKFVLDRLGRCLKLIVSCRGTSCHEFASQFGLEFFYTRKNRKPPSPGPPQSITTLRQLNN